MILEKLYETNTICKWAPVLQTNCNVHGSAELSPYLLNVLHNGVLHVDIQTLDVVNEAFFLFTLDSAAQQQQQNLLYFSLSFLCEEKIET